MKEECYEWNGNEHVGDIDLKPLPPQKFICLLKGKRFVMIKLEKSQLARLQIGNQVAVVSAFNSFCQQRILTADAYVMNISPAGIQCFA